ncbi:MAG TPA: TldD/PmbA family protein [Bacteroidales bacterium]|jgi:PmbA protein|nr:TldD/PmbA family protein [Bacteroidales bacterium]
MNTTEKYSLAEMAIDHALRCGADQVSATIYENRSNDIEIRDQKIDSLKESNRSGLSINLYVNKKYSSHSTNRLKKEDLLKFIEEAVKATKFLAEDEFRALPDPELYYKGGGPDLQTFDPKLDTIDAKTKIDLAMNVLNEAYGKDERIISVSSYYSDSISSSVMVASNGFRGDSSNTRLSLTASVSMKGETGRPNDYWNENALFFDRLVRKDIGSKALERTRSKMNPKKLISGKYPVIVENRVSANLLYPIYQALTGSSLYQKQSFLIGKQNQKITSQLLSAVDDPLIPSGPGSRHFDDEGIAAVRRPIIENGILKSYYIDNYYGKKLGMKPNSGSSSNVICSTGNKNLKELIASVKKGVLITGFIGGNFNGSTGDFSYGIEGFYIENGGLVHPVNEMNITGNMNSFWLNLADLGNDFREGDSLRIPSLLFDNIDLSGK